MGAKMKKNVEQLSELSPLLKGTTSKTYHLLRLIGLTTVVVAVQEIG